MLPRRLDTSLSEAQRLLWAVVRLDTMALLAGDVIFADCDNGTATMRTRGPDGDWVQTTYQLGAGSIAIVGRRR